MAHDPARALKKTPYEIRKMMQEQCRQVPCTEAEKGKPVCVFCCNEKPPAK